MSREHVLRPGVARRLGGIVQQLDRTVELVGAVGRLFGPSPHEQRAVDLGELGQVEACQEALDLFVLAPAVVQLGE